MKINYDKVADAIYFAIKEAKIFKTLAVSEFLNVDIDKKGETVGIELLNASSKQGVELEKSIRNGVPVEVVAGTPVTA